MQTANNGHDDMARAFSFRKTSLVGLIVLAMGTIAFVTINTSHNVRSLRNRNLEVSEDLTFNAGSRELQIDEFDRKIAWLMSFPEAGATNLMHLVHTLSQKSTATNYGGAMMGPAGNIYRLQGDNALAFQSQPGPALSTTLEIPEKHVLTRTHGWGYCFDCPPWKYLGPSAYLKHMHMSFYANIVTNNEPQTVKYDTTLVQKMLILFRDPMDNVAARFFQKRQREMNIGNIAYGTEYPNNVDGFEKYCTDVNNGIFMDEEVNWYTHAGFLEEAKLVPCRSEFIKIFTFYNMARQVGVYYTLDMMIVRTKDLALNLDNTMNDVLGFLDLTRVDPLTPRNDLSNGEGLFSHFYTNEQRTAIAILGKKMCLPAVWDGFAPYLEKYLPQ